jgi:hypothetical protein
VAIRLRDSAAVAEWFAEADSYSFEQLVMAGWWANDGGDIEAALRATRQALAIATTESERSRALLEMRRRHWAAGQPQAAARVTERMGRELRDPLGLESEVVHVALFLDGDSAQADAAARDIEESLRRKGMDVGIRSTFDESEITATDIYRLCYVGLWRAATGEDATARAIEEQMTRFDDGDDESYRSLHARVCALELRAMRADAGDRATIAAQLDSIAATGPDLGPRGRNRTNMVLARLYGALGDPQRAMTVAMRGDWFDFGGYSAMWREAARYAIAARDTAMAAYYLDWFLRPRANAEPEVRARDDELRAQLAQLLGEGGRN